MNKLCKSCATEKSLSEFNRRNDRGDGMAAYSNLCKLCKKEYNKNYREKNREKMINHSRNWRINNP